MMNAIIVRTKQDCMEVESLYRKRIAVLGVSGSGKTTLAIKLSEKYGIPHIELDALYLNENWRESTNEEFRRKLKDQLDGKEDFIIDGNYSSVSDLTWDNCNVLICLDFSRVIIMKRIITRTIKRVITKEELWNGNIESFRKSFLSKDSIIMWSWNTFKRRKDQYQFLQEKYKYEDKTMIFIRNNKAFEMILN